VIECDPAVSGDAPQVALGFRHVAIPPLTVPVPSVVGGVVLPSVNVTVPVAVEGDTVAVSVTDDPNVDGLADEASVVFVLTCWTVWARLEETLLLSFASPL